MLNILFNKIPLNALHDNTLEQAGVKLSVLRADLNHPSISGNKLFKLKHNLIKAHENKCDTLLTFGGAYSNHIAATAAAGAEYGFKTIGVIRGEAYEKLNPTLYFAKSQGMELQYVSRSLYRDKVKLMESLEPVLSQKNNYVIPEGGSNTLGVKGCEEITNYIKSDFDYVALPCGTGTTMAGVVNSLKKGQKAIGFQVLKADGYINDEVKKQVNVNVESWNVNENYHFGGYAKRKESLSSFMAWFEKMHGIPLDFVYTGKMMYGIYDMIKKGMFAKGVHIVAIHTGGLQGNAGFIK